MEEGVDYILDDKQKIESLERQLSNKKKEAEGLREELKDLEDETEHTMSLYLKERVFSEKMKKALSLIYPRVCHIDLTEWLSELVDSRRRDDERKDTFEKRIIEQQKVCGKLCE